MRGLLNTFKQQKARNRNYAKNLRQTPNSSGRSVNATPLRGETAAGNAGLDLAEYSLNWIKQALFIDPPSPPASR